MTRLEAIAILDGFKYNPLLNDQHYEALDMAVSVLSENWGEWIPKERTTDCSLYIDIVCSKCGYVGIETYAYGYELNEINIQKVRDYTKELDLNFCPCCGADMRAESEEI